MSARGGSAGGEQPDHSSIANFLVRHQQASSREFFLRLVYGLVGRKGITNGVVAGDATVIEVAANRFSMLSQEAAEQAAAEAQASAAQQPDDPGRAHAALLTDLGVHAATLGSLQWPRPAPARSRRATTYPICHRRPHSPPHFPPRSSLHPTTGLR